MSKATKQLLVDEIAKRLHGVTGLVACSTQGLKSQELVHFRAVLRQKNVRALMVKNAMCARAFDGLGLGYAYYRTRSLVAPVVMHGLFNGYNLALTIFLPYLQNLLKHGAAQ